MSHTTNYLDSFIAVAADCKARAGTVPPEKEPKTVARAQYDMIAAHPYRHSSDDVIFAVYAERKGIPPSRLKAEREAFFSKGQPCLRSSPLGKTYGWGIHSDSKGRVALYGVESGEYARLASDPAVKRLEAMRSVR